MKALIDGDVLRYQCGFAAEKPIWRVMVHGEVKPRATFRYKKELNEWVAAVGLAEEEYTAVKDKEIEPVANALSNAKALIKKILLRTGADEWQIYLTGKDNFRDTIATILPYKGNRESSNKPHHYDSLTRYLTENWGAVTVDGIEADDAMATEQSVAFGKVEYFMSEDGILEDTTICTIDKDLHMIPGNHYNFNKDILHWIDDDTAITWFYCQLIMGDKTVDNIQGIPGAGKAKAKKVLMDCEDEEDMFWAVLELYHGAYERPLEALIENARLLWMRREEGVDWNPPA